LQSQAGCIAHSDIAQTYSVSLDQSFQSQAGGVQVTHLWKLGDSPIVSRADFPEKQEQVTCQLKSAPSFDQQSSKELNTSVLIEQQSSK
jgi:hypothetical protein